MPHLLTLLVVVPVAGALVAILYSFAPGRREEHYKWIAFVTTLVIFARSLLLLRGIVGSGAEFRFEENVGWISSIGARYHLGVDGISLWLVLLTTLLMPIAILSSWTAITKRLLSYFVFLLVLESAMIGVFVSLDLLLFYLFFEASLVPMFFLIGIWGGERRIYAAVKFFIYTSVGSLLMLVAIITIYFVYHSFDYPTLVSAMSGDPRLAGTLGYFLFLAFAIAFGIKVPIFPFHTWLPDAHTEAPTAGSVILAGVLLKMGTYGFIRFSLPLLPADAAMRARIIHVVIVLSLIGIIYGALVCLMQKDMKRLIAYSSVSHLGFCTLGIFALTPNGLSGSVLQQINHGISTGALFFIVGVLYERRHTRMISEVCGLATPMPNFPAIYLIISLSSLGMPLLDVFIGEFTILQGAFQVSKAWAAWGSLGVVLGAAYLLWLYQRVMFGPVTQFANENLPDLNLL